MYSFILSLLSVVLSVFQNSFVALIFFFISGLHGIYLEEFMLYYSFMLLLQFLCSFKSLL